MDMYGINSESISDFGCRKILGIKSPFSRSLSGIRYSKAPLKQDTYMQHRKNISNQNSIAMRDKLIKTGIVASIFGLTSVMFSKIKKNIALRKASETAKVSVFSKIKNLFKKG